MNLPESELERLLLEHVERENYRPVKPKVIAKQLGIPEDGQRELKRAIKRLVKQGRLSFGARHLVQRAAAKAQSEFLQGVFRRTSRGFGFVTPADEPQGDKPNDIYIAPDKTADAADGDRVAVKLFRRRGPYGRRAGRIVDVVERKSTRFVGTYRVQGKAGVVHVDGNRFDAPIHVGDASAKDCQVDDKVVVEMLRFPTHLNSGEGVIVEVLGARDRQGVDTMTIMREFNLPESFPDAVQEDARREADAFDETALDDRTDLTELTVITIDPADARDFDDAISLTRDDRGHWSLGVHIADVAHFVRPNTALDNEAYKRATSVYLPDRVVPMLPELISNGLASLQPDRVRFARTVTIEYSPEGQRIKSEVRRSAIRSCRRFSYEEVDSYLEDRERWQKELTPEVDQLLSGMHELAMMLRKRRLSRGAIELDMPEVKLDLDRAGAVQGASIVQRTESHQIIEEFMLAANIAVAETIADQDLLLLRRIHPIPTARKMQDLTEFVRGLGIECGTLNDRFEIKRVLGEVQSKPIAPAINLAVLKSMQKAIYSPREEGHYALHEPNYCHFTSPIRRYPDLVIHRMLDSLEQGQRPANEFGHLSRLGQHCSFREQDAEKAERELIRLKLINHLVDHIGEEMEALITGVEPYGLFVQGRQLPVEGLMPLEAMGRERYDYDSTDHSLIGRSSGRVFHLGGSVLVRVLRADPDARQVDFELADTLSRRGDGKSQSNRERRGPGAGGGGRGGPSGRGKSAGKSMGQKRGKSTVPKHKRHSGGKKKRRRR